MSDAAPRVDFYVLGDSSAPARLRFACRLTEKAVHGRHRVYALTTDERTARELDELLWTFRAESFVPHAIRDGEAADAVPVTIGWDANTAQGGGELLINLTAAVPACFDTYQRVAEIIDASDAGRRAGRERFRFYRDNGLDPLTHRIG